MKIPDLQKLLTSLDVKPSRKLGQNFLVDDNVSRWIVDQLDIRPSDTVVEVGPGMGALTKHIVGSCRKLILVEKDTKFANYLSDHYSKLGRNIEVVNADAAQFDIRPLFKEGRVKFIGNLPYSAATPILENFLDPPSPVEKAVVMVQKEVAMRICAEAKTKPYGVLSVILQRRWNASFLKTVGPEMFHPRPEVDSSIIRLDPKEEVSWPQHSPETFVETVKKGFAQRRKQLHNNLAVSSEEWDEIVKVLEVKRSVRAEELSVSQWITLSNQFEKHPAKDLGPSSGEPLDVVDSKDNVLEQVSRSEVHSRNLRHRAVHVFVFNKHGELYLQKRSHWKDTHGGKWDSSASGHLDPGESYEDCAVRELHEELFTLPKDGVEKVLKLEAGPGTDNEFVELYRCENKGKIRLHTSEIDSGGYFRVDEIEAWIKERRGDFATGFVTCFKAFLEEEKKREAQAAEASAQEMEAL